jgi:hypothetical protein
MDLAFWNSDPPSTEYTPETNMYVDIHNVTISMHRWPSTRVDMHQRHKCPMPSPAHVTLTIYRLMKKEDGPKPHIRDARTLVAPLQVVIYPFAMVVGHLWNPPCVASCSAATVPRTMKSHEAPTTEFKLFPIAPLSGGEGYRLKKEGTCKWIGDSAYVSCPDDIGACYALICNC